MKVLMGDSDVRLPDSPVVVVRGEGPWLTSRLKALPPELLRRRNWCAYCSAMSGITANRTSFTSICGWIHERSRKGYGLPALRDWVLKAKMGMHCPRNSSWSGLKGIVKIARYVTFCTKNSFSRMSGELITSHRNVHDPFYAWLAFVHI